MASTRLRTLKDGTRYYEIRVSMGRGKPYLTHQWYVPDGWSQKAIERKLLDVAKDFERRCHAGEVLTYAERKAKEEEERLAAEAEAAKVRTVRQYVEQVYMPEKVVSLAENTRTSYQGNFDNWIFPAIGEIVMGEVTSSEIKALLLDMQAKGKAHGTCVKVYNILSDLFKTAYIDEKIQSNPMSRVKRPAPRKDEIKSTEAEAYTVEEMRYILKCLDAEPLKWRAFVRLLIDTGVRRGEACGLTWPNVDFKNNTITIAGNLCYTPDKGVYMDTPKNGKTRTIGVDPEVMLLLKHLRAEQASTALSRFVFTQDGSAEPMHPQSPTRYLKKFAKRNDIENLHPHKLRHSFASIAITNGADIASVSEKLGHSDKAVTLRMYTHADQESINRASNIFRDALKAKEA